MNEETTNGEPQNADEVLPDEDLEQAAGGINMFNATPNSYVAGAGGNGGNGGNGGAGGII